MALVIRNGSRTKPEARNSVQASNVSGTRMLDPSLLPPRVCITRELESGAELGLHPKDSDTYFVNILTTRPNTLPKLLAFIILKRKMC